MTESHQSPQPTQQARILLVDNQVQERICNAQAIRAKGYHVDETDSGTKALALLEDTPYDLIVLEMALQGITGEQTMHQARQMRRDLQIIVLTAHATAESAIAAVKSNAVDYLLKPCRPADLLLVIEHALREREEQLRQQRVLGMVGEALNALHQIDMKSELQSNDLQRTRAIPTTMENILQQGVLALDRPKRIVTLKTNPPYSVELTEGEMSILIALMEKPNQVLSCNQLADTALGYQGMDKWTVENVVRSSVFRLRQKLEPNTDAPRLIRTVRGRGYFFSPA